MYGSVAEMAAMLRNWTRQLMRLEEKSWLDTTKEMGVSSRTLYRFLHTEHSNPRLSTLLAVEEWCRRFEPIPGGRKGDKKQ